MSFRTLLFSRRPRSIFLRVGLFLLLIAASLFAGGCFMFKAPGKSYRGPLPATTAEQAALAEEMRRVTHKLSVEIGERNVWKPDALRASADYLADELARAGFEVQRHAYKVQGVTCENVEATLRGASKPEQIVVVGAHYDSLMGTVGANDNASGVAAVVALAHRWGARKPARTLRLLAVVNEEPPFYHSLEMGSLVYAKACRARGDDVVAMISFDGIGYFSDAPHSQDYPAVFKPFFPDTANFIGLQGNFASRDLVHRAARLFREKTKFPSEAVALPGDMPAAGMSDHWSFWQVGYPAILVTDTLPFRYAHYHTTDDTIDKIDFDRAARVVEGIDAVAADLLER